MQNNLFHWSHWCQSVLVPVNYGGGEKEVAEFFYFTEHISVLYFYVICLLCVLGGVLFSRLALVYDLYASDFEKLVSVIC